MDKSTVTLRTRAPASLGEALRGRAKETDRTPSYLMRKAIEEYLHVPNDGNERRPFIPIEGQSFRSHRDWVNRATRCLTAHPDYNNTEHSTDKPWRGHHFTALCFDQQGRSVRNGGDFQRAEADDAFPVWWVWPDQIAGLLTKGVGPTPSTPGSM